MARVALFFTPTAVIVAACVVAALVVAVPGTVAQAGGAGTVPSAATDPAAEQDRAARDVSTLAAREALVGQQTEAARASARWRLRALYRFAIASGPLPPVVRARALNVGARAVARDVAEARVLDDERARTRTDRAALAVAAAVEPEIGPPPALTWPVAGAVLTPFGVSSDRATGLLLSRAGLRVAATPGQGVRAPAAATVVAVTAEPTGVAVVLDHGAQWTTIVSGLGAVTIAAGDRVVAGQRLGIAATGPAPAVGLEVWRGRHPVDPALLTRRPAAPLAAPARLP